MQLRTLSIVLFFRSVFADSHATCQCVINGVADNGLTYAGALLYADAAGWGGLNNTCIDPWDGVVVDWTYNPAWITACDYTDDIGIDGDMIATACSSAQWNVAQATNGWSYCP